MRRSPCVRRIRQALRTTAPAVLPALFLLHLFGCAPAPVRIGVLLPLTGRDAPLGEPQRAAMELAADAVNAAGGIGGRPLELRFADTLSDKDAAFGQASALLGDEAVAALLCGGSTEEALSSAEESRAKGRVLLCTAAVAPDLAGAGEWVFRNCPANTAEAQVLSGFAAYSLHADQALLLWEDRPEPAAFKEAFRRAFGEAGRTAVAIPLPTAAPAADREAVAAIRAARAQVAVVACGPSAFPAAAAALRRAGFTGPLLAAGPGHAEAFLASPAEAPEALLLAVPGWDPTSSEPRAAAFVSEYRARTGHEAGPLAAQAYDAVHLLSSALRDRGRAPDEIRRGLQELRGVQGVAGTTTFEEGGVIRPFEMWVVSGGRPMPLQPVRARVLPPLQARVGALRFGGR